ncbi:hypothetical protein [uncultured Bifidobacterium sp.]|uniref:hypothetical protein n=1 Tax=uncultured Bifidobacterium sp. TaxID=165187 RepID=UPI00258D645A|nr:hypothetical protein [uncultured Bifidobacterium sp.]
MPDDAQKWPDLTSGEEDITNSKDVCFRNVHPEFITNGTVSSQAFRPSDNDNGQLSTARSSKVGAQQHYQEFTHFGHKSAGVYQISTNDIQEAGLRWVDNEANQEESLHMTGHAYLDYRIYSNSQIKKKARNLSRKATIAFRAPAGNTDAPND